MPNTRLPGLGEPIDPFDQDGFDLDDAITAEGMEELMDSMLGPNPARLFLDTADASALKGLLPLGCFFGVTCNPTILKRDGVPCTLDGLTRLTRAALDAGAVEVHLQAWGGSADNLLACARALLQIASDVVIKLPLTREGVQAARPLIDQGTPVTLTGVYAVHQALTAASLGAAYVAPYHGRLADRGADATAAVLAMQKIVDKAMTGCRLLVASLRDPDTMAMLAAEGCDTFTVGPQVAQALFTDPHTSEAAEAFEADAIAAGAAPVSPTPKPRSRGRDRRTRGGRR